MNSVPQEIPGTLHNALRSAHRRAIQLLWPGLALVLGWAAQVTIATTAEDARAFAAIHRGGVAVLLRHAQTVPGLGDPPGFKLGVCDTQRNLSVDGRAAATRFGERLRQAGVRFTGVYTSQWCRCRDTATLIAGQAEDWPALNSFFDDRDAEPKQSAEVRQRIAALKPGETLLLVTHQVNITAITSIVPAMGEAVIVRTGKGGAVEVVGRLAGG